jgi:aldehyde dehydrogenase (NAD+)
MQLRCTQSFSKVVSGGKILVEGGVLSGAGYESASLCKTGGAEANNTFEIVQHETAPVLYLLKYSERWMPSQSNRWHTRIVFCNHDEQLKKQNCSCLLWFRLWDCECKTSEHLVAEIGGAFGGEKDTGGGRESGSDAWKYT